MIAKQLLRALHAVGLTAGISIICVANVNGQSIRPLIGTPLPDPPQVVTSFELQAINDPATGKGAFVFEGHEVPPVVRAVPGGVIQLEYVNQMSRSSSEVCVDGPCMNMTNLHFHGLHVSPDAPGDDVLTMMAMPGESLHYTVDIPADQPPGLYWYHTHPHGESYQQALDGMSGAIVIDGMDRYFPEIKNMKEKILILRDAELKQGDPSSALLTGAVELAPYGCGAATGKATRVFTVNGVARPKIAIAYGEKQFWRIVNASPDLCADLEVDSESMIVVALILKSCATCCLPRPVEAEVIVKGPMPGRATSLRSLASASLMRREISTASLSSA